MYLWLLKYLSTSLNVPQGAGLRKVRGLTSLIFDSQGTEKSPGGVKNIGYIDGNLHLAGRARFSHIC